MQKKVMFTLCGINKSNMRRCRNQNCFMFLTASAILLWDIIDPIIILFNVQSSKQEEPNLARRRSSVQGMHLYMMYVYMYRGSRKTQNGRNVLCTSQNMGCEAAF